MPEGLATADGQKINLDDVDQEFAAAMAAPRSDEPEHPAPPRQDFGIRLDGQPKRGPGGRPPKPRMVEAPKDAPKGKGGKEQASTGPDYAKALGEFLGGLQIALAVIPIPSDNVRVHMRYQSAVIEKTGDGLATGLGTVAEHNSMVRWGVEKLTQGGGAWVFPAALAIAPFAVSTAMLWRAPVTPEMAEGAEKIEQEAMARLKAEMGFEQEAPDAGSPAAA